MQYNYNFQGRSQVFFIGGIVGPRLIQKALKKAWAIFLSNEMDLNFKPPSPFILVIFIVLFIAVVVWQCISSKPNEYVHLNHNVTYPLF